MSLPCRGVYHGYTSRSSKHGITVIVDEVRMSPSSRAPPHLPLQLLPHPPPSAPPFPKYVGDLLRLCGTRCFFLQRIADRIHASGWTRGIGVEGVEDLAEEGEVVGDEGIVDEHDSAWLLEQNAWLMEELDSKDGECFFTVGACGLPGIRERVGAGAGLRGYCLRPGWRGGSKGLLVLVVELVVWWWYWY